MQMYKYVSKMVYSGGIHPCIHASMHTYPNMCSHRYIPMQICVHTDIYQCRYVFTQIYTRVSARISLPSPVEIIFLVDEFETNANHSLQDDLVILPNSCKFTQIQEFATIVGCYFLLLLQYFHKQYALFVMYFIYFIKYHQPFANKITDYIFNQYNKIIIKSVSVIDLLWLQHKCHV